MKVLHIINSLVTGGAEKLVLDTVPLYNIKGITADVLVFKNDNYPFYNKLKESKTCKLYNLNIAWVYNPLSIFKMIGILKKYDLVHVHLFPAQYFVVIAKILSLNKIKLVFTEHATSNRRLKNKFYKAIDKWIYRFYKKIVVLSPKIKEIIKTHTNLPSNRFEIIENGVAIKNIIEALPTDKELIHHKLNSTDLLLIQVAAFREQKDQETLIRAMTLLPNDCRLLLVGDGATKLRCQNLVVKLLLTDRVFFLGIRADIPSLLKTADIVVLSSHYEGMSLSSIEGMVSGKPFVASNVPGLKKMVKGHGVLFEDNNEKELAACIDKLLKDQQYYKKVAEACVAHAKKFDINKMVDKHISLYSSIINN